MAAKKNKAPKITKLQTVEFAQVLVLVLIGLALYYNNRNLIVTALVVTFISLIVPKIFYPLAIAWFGLSKVLSAVSSKILMGIVFFVMVVPVGIYRKLAGIDNLKLRRFKKSRESVMVSRDHVYEERDFLNTF